MSNGNPFYVHPGGDWSAGLAGLGQAMSQAGENRQRRQDETDRKQRFADVQTAMMGAYDSGDPEQMMRVAIEYPESQQTMEMMFGYTNDKTKNISKDIYGRILSDPANAVSYLEEGINAVSEAGGSPDTMMGDLGMFMADPEAALNKVEFGFAGIAPDMYKAYRDMRGGTGGLASAKTEILSDGSVIQALPSGDVQVRNPQGQIVTGQARSDVLAQSQQSDLIQRQAISDISVGEATGKAEATQRASRVSDITKELSTRNRDAKRGAINLRQASTLIEKATQGTEGAFKVQLAKLFPGIDVGDEAALSQSLTNLALDELQKFKGPTTDFEFQKTEQIAGTLGDSKSANRAKVASLQRANWFNQREAKQFQDHIKAGKNPDTFGFNFTEQIKTKRGDFSLQDLQDTAVDNNITIEETIKRLNK